MKEETIPIGDIHIFIIEQSGDKAAGERYSFDEVAELVRTREQITSAPLLAKIEELEKENKPVDGKWKLIPHSYQIADTGDYDGHYEITDGKVSLFTKDDNDEGLQKLVFALNKTECKFYLDDANEVDNYILRYDNSQLQKRISELEGENNNLRIQLDWDSGENKASK